jgi:uncharacterized coiled-coil protein SlyX
VADDRQLVQALEDALAAQQSLIGNLEIDLARKRAEIEGLKVDVRGVVGQLRHLVAAFAPDSPTPARARGLLAAFDRTQDSYAPQRAGH